MKQNNSSKENPIPLPDSFRKVCTKAGLKVTHQRLQIYHKLLESNDHPTAETLFDRLRTTMPTLSLDTVYRTLSTFEQHHLVKRVKTDHFKARYEAKMNLHHHFICKKCEIITDFHWPAFDRGTLPEEVTQLGTIFEHTITVSGICRTCTNPCD